MWKYYALRIGAVVLVAVGTVVSYLTYQRKTAFPVTVRMASGPDRGRYRQITKSLKQAIESQTTVRVELIPTEGSLENIEGLDDGELDFALFQSGADRTVNGDRPQPNVTFVGNLYSEATHLIVSKAAEIGSPDDLKGRDKHVNLGQRDSGDYAVSLILLDHFDLDEKKDFVASYMDYASVRDAFREGELDAAFITAGDRAPIFYDLLKSGENQLLSLPHADALAAKHILVSRHTIPAGLYRSREPARPSQDVETIASQAQLLANQDLPDSFVEKVTQIVMSEQFQKENNLLELFAHRNEFAQRRAEFPVHPGAKHFYDPSLKPLLDTSFVESTEGLRSFVVSVLIAMYLIYRWLERRQTRAKEHRLDRYIHSLLDIERRQLPLDDHATVRDDQRLQDLLDEVTALRQEALSDFSAHDLHDDRAIECFLQMCHALSDKINAKIARQRLDSRFDELIAQAAGKSSPQPPGAAL